MASCDPYLELLSARLDGMTTSEEERELEAHLAVCPACRALESQLAAIHAAFPELEEIPAPEGFAQTVMDRIRAEETKRPKVIPLFRRPKFRAAVGMAACLVLCLGVYQSGLLSQRNCGDAAAELAPAQGEGSDKSGMDLSRSKAADSENLVAATALEPEAYVDSNETAPEGAAYQARNVQQTVPEPLVLEQLPDGAEAVLGGEALWEADTGGNLCCTVTAAQLEALLALALDQGMEPLERPAGPLDEGGAYRVILSQES